MERREQSPRVGGLRARAEAPPTHDERREHDAKSGATTHVADPANQMQRLQSLVGNRAISAKLEVGDVDSPHEREADAVARQVAGTSRSPGAHTSQNMAIKNQALTRIEPAVGQGGRRFDDEVRAPVEDHLGVDLSGARLHTGADADEMSRSIGAKAFTAGSDVYFKNGAFDPSSSSGQELIAHELTHVAQQPPVVSRALDDEEEVGPGSGGVTFAPGPADAFEKAKFSSRLASGSGDGYSEAAPKPGIGARAVEAANSGGSAFDAAEVGLGAASAVIGGASGQLAGAAVGVAAGGITYGAVSGAAGLRQMYTGHKTSNALDNAPTKSKRGDQAKEYAQKKMTKRKRGGALNALLGAGAAGVSIAGLLTGGAALGIIGLVIAGGSLGLGLYRFLHTRKRRATKKREYAALIAAESKGTGDAAVRAQQLIASLGVEASGDEASIASKLESRLGKEFESKRFAVAQDMVEMLVNGEPQERFDASALLKALNEDPGRVREQYDRGEARAAIGSIAAKLNGWN